MAPSSQQCSPSLLQPALLPNSPIRSISPSLSDFGDIKDTFFSCYPSDPHLNVALDVTVFGESYLQNKDRMMLSSGDRDPPVIEKWNTDSSSVVIEPQSCDKVTLEKTQIMDKRRKNDQFKDVLTQGKDKKRKKYEYGKEKKDSEETPTAYVQVRARRGQATDSHSLAERARREKISTKMKQLQALVPGCDKMNGKALVLDAIINYVLSLQNQVESLSMKLASVNPMSYGFGGDLDEFMKLGSLAICGTQPTVLPEDATTFINTTNNCSILESCVSGSLQQDLGPFFFCQQDDYENLLGDVEEQEQIMLKNQFSEFNNNSCYF